VVFTQALTLYQIYHTWIHLLNHILHTLSPILGVISTAIIFALTHMCTYFIAPYSPSYLLSPPGQDLFCPTVLQFCRRKKRKEKMKKKDTSALDKGSYRGSFLVIFHVCIYYNPNWFISILLYFLSYGSFSPFKISIFILVYWFYQCYSSSQFPCPSHAWPLLSVTIILLYLC
jgi:hypothetical protein